MNNDGLLRIEGISKAFPGVQALSELSMEIRRGEILALVGENGAGKSTLIKLLSGVYQPDEGRILIDGREARFHNPLQAVEAGIGVVYQELSLAPNLSVAENTFGGRPPTGSFGLMDMPEMQKKTAELLDQFQAEFNSWTRVGSLSMGNQQLVEIIKALATNAKILILDEPTSSLSLQEAKILFERLKQLKERGITILYVSHHLEEIFEISDRVTVLRDGRYVGTKNTAETNEKEIVSMMVGRKLDETDVLHGTGERGVELLRVENVTRKSAFKNISFSVHKGEVLTFFGLVGSGRTEVARALIGLDTLHSGKVVLRGKEVHISSPAKAIQLGMAYLSEDRKSEGLFLDKTIKENFLATNLKQVSPGGWLSWGKLQSIVQEYVTKLEIRTPSLDQRINNLSGGNQQKVLLGEWLATEPELLIVDEPTRGIDVGTKLEIHKLLRSLADSGKGIMVISSDLPEALRISDRIAVMRRGQLVGFLTYKEANEERVMELAAGVASSNNQTGEIS
jgi:ribose transport system ATP-binding protein